MASARPCFRTLSRTSATARFLLAASLAAALAAPFSAKASGPVQETTQEQRPHYPPEEPPTRFGENCALIDAIIAGPGIAALPLKPVPGRYRVTHNDVIPLIGLASDEDKFRQVCECSVLKEKKCETEKKHEMVDPVAYTWKLTGPGSLLGPGYGPSNLYQPPSLPAGASLHAEIVQSIADAGGNDPATRIRYVFDIHRISHCEYERSIQVFVEGGGSGTAVAVGPPPPPATRECDCQPQAAVTWKKEPAALDAMIKGPAFVEAGKRYVMEAGGADEDALPLWCSGLCGYDARSFPLPDEINYTWTADRGSYPDHNGSSAGTNSGGTTAIYRAPDAPGPERIYIDVRDSMVQGIDDRVKRKLELTVLKVDLDVDSDNTRKVQVRREDDPERTRLEDDIEADRCMAGKAVRVNNGDRDVDGVRDVADGFNMHGQEDDDASGSFTPVIVEIMQPIDLDKATARFTYSASDPAGVRRRKLGDGSYAYLPAPGRLRLWARDGGSERNKDPLNRKGDFAAPLIEYSVKKDFPAPFASRKWRFFLEGVRVSDHPGDRRIVLEVDPDGPGGPLGYLRDIVEITVTEEQLVLGETMEDELPAYYTRTRPAIELEPVDLSQATVAAGGIVTVHLKGVVRDKLADILPNGAGDIPWVRCGGTRLAVTRDPGEPASKLRPYAFKGNFEGDVQVLFDPEGTEILVESAENVLGLRGQVAVNVSGAPASSSTAAMLVTGADIVRRTTTVPRSSASTGTSTGARAAESDGSGCFRPYFGRIHDVRGLQGGLEIERTSSPLEPDRGAHWFISKEPFVFLDRPAKIADDHLIVLQPPDPAEWKYATLEGEWPVINVDVDVDADEDETINDDDDPLEDLKPGAVIAPNVDDDDGDGRPDNADRRVNGGDDWDDMTPIVLRKPEGVSDDALVEAVVRRKGSGSIRLFTKSGGGRLVLDRNKTETGNLWKELKTGDLTLYAEGVGRGDVELEFRLSLAGAHCADFVAAHVPTFKLEIGLDEPNLDYDDDERGRSGYLEIPADQVVVDFENISQIGAVNLFANYYREDELKGEDPIPDRTVRWEVEAHPSNRGSRAPMLRDLTVPTSSYLRQVPRAQVVGGFSIVQLDMTGPYPSEPGRRRAVAGDMFIARAIADTDDGRRLVRELPLLVVPGNKLFHVTNPSSVYDPSAATDMTDGPFDAAYGAGGIALAVSSGARTRINAYLSDTFRNALEAGRPVSWMLQGSGVLGDFDPSEDAPASDNVLHDTVGPGGLVSILYTQTKYGSCPWQPEPKLEPTDVYLAADDRLEPVTRSMTKRTDPLPPRLGPVHFDPVLHSVLRTGEELDIYKRETKTLDVRVTRELGAGRVPLPNVQVAFTSLNGRLDPADGIVFTDANGYAAVTLTAEGATVGPITVTAAMGEEGRHLTDYNIRWINSGPSQVTAEHAVLVGDAVGDGVIRVETLDDRGDANPGNGLLEVPYHGAAKYRIIGQPNHVYTVEVRDDLSWGAAARYPFDEVTPAGTTADVVGRRDADVHTAAIDWQEKAEGLASLSFGGSDSVELPGSAAVELRGGLLLSFWVRAEEVQSAVLLERTGQYRLDLLGPGEGSGPGYLRLTLNSSASAVLESAAPIRAGEWFYVEVMYDGSRMRVSVGERPDRRLAAYGSAGAVQAVNAGTPVLAGTGFRGRLDDIRFTKAGMAPPVVRAVGLAQGTITTNGQGRAEFTVRSTGSWDPDRYLPVRMTVDVSGSETSSAESWVVPKSIYGHLVNVGHAFLAGTEGLRDDASILEKAAAWASEAVPLLADLRTLGFEAYKAATGCDEVSALNVSFAVAGLVADVASFGTAGTAIRVSRVAVKEAIKAVLKSMAKGVAISAVTEYAFASVSEFALKEVLRADCAEKANAPPECGTRSTAGGWVTGIKDFFISIKDVVESGQAGDAVSGAFRSVNDIFNWHRLYQEWGAAGPAQFRTLLQDIQAQQP